jgi:hypothetical protein
MHVSADEAVRRDVWRTSLRCCHGMRLNCVECRTGFLGGVIDDTRFSDIRSDIQN